MSAVENSKKVPWFLWPFWAVWQFVSWIFRLTGRLIAVLLGFVLMIAGVLLSITVVLAIVGVPMFIIGLLLVFRGIF